MLSDSHKSISLILRPIFEKGRLSPHFADEKTKAQRGLDSCSGSNSGWRVKLMFKRMQGTGCYREMIGPVRKGWDPKATTSPTPYKRHPLTFPHWGRDLYVSILRLDHIYLNFCGPIVPLESRVLGERNQRWIHFDKGGDWESDLRSWDRVPARRDWVIQSSSRAPLVGLTLTRSGTEILCCFLNESPSLP